MSDRFYIQGGQVFIGVIIYSDQLQWFLLDTPEGQNVWVLVVPWFGSVRFGSLISRTLDPTVVQVRPLGRTSDWTPPPEQFEMVRFAFRTGSNRRTRKFNYQLLI